MPRIIVIAECRTDLGCQVVLQERVVADHLDSDHSAAQLVERVGWAIVDADQLEQADGDIPAAPRWFPPRSTDDDDQLPSDEAA